MGEKGAWDRGCHSKGGLGLSLTALQLLVLWAVPGVPCESPPLPLLLPDLASCLQGMTHGKPLDLDLGLGLARHELRRDGGCFDGVKQAGV